MLPSPSDLGVVVVTHQSSRDLEACVRALLDHQGDLEPRLVVSDAGSTDGVAELAARLPLHFLPGPNRGFAAAVNRALADPALAGARWVLLVNPDVRMVEGSLSQLLARCDALPQVAIATVRTVDQHGDLVLNLGRPVSLRQWMRMALRGVGGDWYSEPERYAGEATAAWAAGSFLLVRRDVLDDLGGLDERFFLYSEEVDLCVRARQAGWQVRYLPSATVVHPLAGRSLDAHQIRLLAWSRLVYLRKWHRAPARLALRAARVLMILRSLVQDMLRGISPRAQWTELLATLRFDPARYGAAPLPEGRRTRPVPTR
jgi:GT2 family glycosyltransferase